MQKVNVNMIRQKMAEKRLTLQLMSEALGYKKASTFSKFLSGHMHLKARHVPILLKKLDITLDDLFFEEMFPEMVTKEVEV